MRIGVPFAAAAASGSSASRVVEGDAASVDGAAGSVVGGSALGGAAAVMWHVELRPVGALRWGDGDSVVLPNGLRPLDAVAMIPGRSTRIPRLVLVEGDVDGRKLLIGEDMVIPDPGEASRTLPLLPLRALPAASTMIRITSPAALDRSRTPMLFEQVIRFGPAAGWWRRIGPRTR